MRSGSEFDERGATLDHNQLGFRQANERVAALNRRWGTDTFPSSFVCECRDPHCVERIVLSHEDYDRLRLNVTFVTRPGH